MRAPLTRELLVARAREVIERDGLAALSLRSLARDVGVTAPALYAHVAGKEALLAAVATAHFERLIDRFTSIVDDDPLDRIRALCRAYVEHAVESPQLFHLMFRYPPQPVAGAEAFPPAERAFAAAATATRAAIATGGLRAEDPDEVSTAMWAAVHGVAEVAIIGFGEPAAFDLLDVVVETMLVGFGAPASPAPSPSPDVPAARPRSRR